MKESCTTSAKRSIFHRDYYDVYEFAVAFNETDEGKELHLSRYAVEQKNKELKVDCGLGAPRTHGRDALDIRAKLASIIVNLKLTVRFLISPNPGFLRSVRSGAS